MDHILAKDRSGVGSWILIVGCPWQQQHNLRDDETGIKGPAFATCAACEYQRGNNLELNYLDTDLCSKSFPERLQCGFNDDQPKLRLVKK